MKKIIALALALLSLCAIFLTSCKDDDGIPDGMKYANSTDAVDYSLFVPERWIIDTANTKITSAHASSTDTTSINVQRLSYLSIDDYLLALDASVKKTYSDVNVVSASEDAIVGGLNAKKYVATVVFGENIYYMIEAYGILKNDYVYSIVISYPGESKDDNLVYRNEFHMETISAILDNFKINDSTKGESTISYECDNAPENMKLASDTKIVEYMLFLPNDWTVERPVSQGNSTISSGYVYNLDKNVNVNVMQWNTPSAEHKYEQWWVEYRNQLLNSYDTDIKDKEYTSLKIADVDSVCAEFSCVIGGKTFNYRIYAIDTRGSIHIITFTACEEAISTYDSDINQIISSFRFK